MDVLKGRLIVQSFPPLHPLNLNTASREELARIPFLTAEQIEDIQAYVYQYHGMSSEFITIFQTGWFIESMWTQTMVIYMLRSPKLPFIQSRPALSVVMTTLAAVFFVTLLPYGPFAALLKVAPLNGTYFLFLILVMILYMASITFVKHLYIKKYHEWL